MYITLNGTHNETIWVDHTNALTVKTDLFVATYSSIIIARAEVSTRY